MQSCGLSEGRVGWGDDRKMRWTDNNSDDDDDKRKRMMMCVCVD